MLEVPSLVPSQALSAQAVLQTGLEMLLETRLLQSRAIQADHNKWASYESQRWLTKESPACTRGFFYALFLENVTTLEVAGSHFGGRFICPSA